jgi:hypothetical protein
MGHLTAPTKSAGNKAKDGAMQRDAALMHCNALWRILIAPRSADGGNAADGL